MSTSSSPAGSHRSFTGNHYLVEGRQYDFVHPKSALEEPIGGIWTFSRGTVIWRIWPAVLLHSLFAAAVVVITEKTPYNLAIANALLVVVGVVIGFVISYRAMSGYDRYNQGRTMWGDVIKTCRTMGRLVWLHVPPKLAKDRDPTPDEVKLAISEKKFALGLIEGFAVAVKHHLRTETGMYYADLYYLLAPLHPALKSVTSVSRSPGEEPATVVSSPKPTQIPFSEGVRKRPNHPAVQAVLTASPHIDYGTINQYPRAEEVDEHQPLLPSMPRRKQTVAQAVSVSMIPFWTIFVWIWNVATLKSFRKVEQLEEDDRRQSTPYSHRKRRPKVAGGGTNLPLDVIRALSEWLAVLDTRGTVNGSAYGGMMSCLQTFENTLTDLERVLTTPLPLIYSAHLRTVWLYLFFLPFQLVEPLGYLTILAVAIAAFLYLGFLAAGEEIEQPFGYEENDLDLDLFILEIIHYDIDALLARSSPNSYATLKATGHDQANANTSQGLLADYGRILQAAKTRKHDDAQSAPKNTSAPKEAPVELGAAPTIIHALADRSDAPLQKASTLLAASEP